MSCLGPVQMLMVLRSHMYRALAAAVMQAGSNTAAVVITSSGTLAMAAIQHSSPLILRTLQQQCSSPRSQH